MLGKIALSVALAALLASLAVVGFLHAQPQPAPVKRTILQRADVPGTNLEVVYAAVEIAAGVKAGRHSHPGTVFAKIVDGDFWFALDGQPEKVVKAGESLTIPDRAIHNEGATDKPVKLDVVYIVEKGKPLAAPAQ
jgi:quercetin dioxygenase-like cupin family protein